MGLREGVFMDSVYVPWHVHDVNGDDDEKLIGIYRSEEDAKAAIERLKVKPGFKETQDGFSVHKYPLNRDSWEEGFVRASS
jgi:hypothetical protein